MPVVAIDALTLETLRSVKAHTDPSVTVIVVGTSSLLKAFEVQHGSEIARASLTSVPVDSPSRSAGLNAAIRASFPSDLAVVLPGMRVADGWLSRLRAAALSDTAVASASPLSLGCGAVKLFDGRESARVSLDGAALEVAGRSLRLRPKIAFLGPGCVYIRRTAFELAGPLREAASVDEALAELALRTNALGMVHVLADDVLVDGEMPEHIEGKADGFSIAIGETFDNDEHGSLHRAKSRARTALRRLSVTIDGRALTGAIGGTQTYTLELILALARECEIAVRVLVPPDLSSRAATALASAPEIELLTYQEAIAGPVVTDVVHRPQQLFTPDDLALLRLVGERVVVGHQDLIAYHNYSYHRDIEAWRAYRRTTRLSLAGADQVAFFSEHALRDALGEDLIPAARMHVIGVGAEPLELHVPATHAPAGLEGSDRFLLCLGADYAHKNRPFAIELLAALRQLGWPGRLVLAGAHVPYGSSRERERELLDTSPELAELVLDVGAVDEAARTWLYAHACSLVYPTTYEGFGLLPLEAARAGLPCLFAPQTSLAEIAGEAATLIPWDASGSASAVLPLLDEGPERTRHLAQLRALGIPKWSEVARQLIGLYEHALANPCSEAAPRAEQELDRENYIIRLDEDVHKLKQIAQEYQDSYHSLEARVMSGLALIDDGGLLTPDQQRGLMRIAGRQLGALALKPLGPLGRIARSDRRESGGPD